MEVAIRIMEHTSFVRANGSSTPHRFAGIKFSNQIMFFRHFARRESQRQCYRKWKSLGNSNRQNCY
jgi:hypothetical protein